MKRLGRVVFMSEAEYYATLVRTSVDDDKMYTAGFNAGKFHSAGGYAHALYALRDRLTVAQWLVIRYRPIAEIFEPSDVLVSLLQDVNGVSDVDAAADFEIVGNRVRLARAKK